MDLLLPILQSSLVEKVIGPIIVLIAIFIFWLRSGSVYTLLDRAWGILAGKTEVSDPGLKTFIQGTRDVEKFRFIFGIKVKNLTEINRFVFWVNQYSIDVVLAQRARRWIDLNDKDLVRNPPTGYVSLRWGLVALILMALAYMPSIFLSPSALLQMKESRVWFVSDSKSISHIRNRWTIKAADCDKPVSELKLLTGFNEGEVDAACSALKSGDLDNVVKRSIRQQKGLAVGLGAVLVYFLSILFFRIVAFYALEEIKKMIDKNGAGVQSAGTLSGLASAEVISD